MKTRSATVGQMMAVVMCWAAMSQAAVLVQDDFNDNSLDGTKWQTSLPPGASVTEAAQKLSLYDGGSLVSVQSIDPAAGAGIVVEGDIVINTSSDRIFFYTHGGGLLQDASGERHNGLRWFIKNFSSTVVLDSVILRGSTGGSLGTATSSSNLTGIVIKNTKLHFVWTTSATSSTFTISVAPGDVSGASGSFTASVPINGPLSFGHVSRYVIFQNNANLVTMDLDNIVISEVPEPSACVVLGLGALALALQRNMRLPVLA